MSNSTSTSAGGVPEQQTAEKKIRKDVRKIKRAVNRIGSDWDIVSDDDRLLLVDPEEYSRRLNSNVENWNRKSVAMIEPLHFLTDCNLSSATRRRMAIESERLATQLIDDISSKVKTQDLDKIMPTEVLLCRSVARYQLENPLGAIDDATKFLSLCVPLRKQMHQDSNQSEETFVFTWMERLALHTQGRCLRHLKDFDGAIADLRASSTAYRFDDGFEDSAFALMNQQLLIAMALKKQGTPRPHYKPLEREKVEKELGIGIYFKEVYNCQGCGKRPPEVKLSLCDRCRKRWFCSRECQVRTWKTVHKDECKLLRATSCLFEDSNIDARPKFFSDSDMREMEWSLERDGFIVDNYNIFLKDPTTGRFFDSLSDKEVFWYPSEETLIRQMMQK
jgi:hypothetical protein